MREVLKVGLFKKKVVTKTYDKENKKPVIKASICNGEQVAGNTAGIISDLMTSYVWMRLECG